MNPPQNRPGRTGGVKAAAVGAKPPAREPGQVSDLEAHVGFWLRFVSNHVSARFARAVEQSGVSVSEWVALRRLHGAGELSPAELVDALGMTKGAISKICARLADKGLITRHSQEADRRAQRIALTAAGKRLVPRLARIADDNDRTFFGHLSVEARAELTRTMMEIVSRNALRDLPVD